MVQVYDDVTNMWTGIHTGRDLGFRLLKFWHVVMIILVMYNIIYAELNHYFLINAFD